jgi:hypothetical protein
VGFEIAPDALNSVQFQSVVRQVLQSDLAALLLDVVAHESQPVRLEAIPDNQEFAPDGRLQCLQELNDLRALDSARKEPEVKAPDTQLRDQGRSDTGNRRGRPDSSSRSRPCAPFSFSARSQRITDWRDTPTCRLTSSRLRANVQQSRPAQAATLQLFQSLLGVHPYLESHHSKPLDRRPPSTGEFHVSSSGVSRWMPIRIGR